jgi:hypothetical protein
LGIMHHSPDGYSLYLSSLLYSMYEEEHQRQQYSRNLEQ